MQLSGLWAGILNDIVFPQLAWLLGSQLQEKRFNKIKLSMGEGRAGNKGWTEGWDENTGKAGDITPA